MSGLRVPSGPLDRDPGGFYPRDEQRTMLLDVLAGVELGVWDKSIVEWLSGYDASTVVTIASLIQRARAADRRRVSQAMAAQSTVISPTDITALVVSADVLGHHGRKELGDGLMRIAQRARPPRWRKPPEPRPPR